MLRGMFPGSAGGPPAIEDRPAWRSRGYLPHFDQAGIVQMLTYRLVDALPLALAKDLLACDHNDPRARSRLERHLDRGLGACFLRDPGVAGLVQENLLHFDGERYRLIAWVVMPNHVHAVIEMGLDWTLSTVVQSRKSYTAKAANKLLRRDGPFWQPEYYDRAVRDERHLSAAVAYVEGNPVEAGLVKWPEDWRFSSATVRGPTSRAGEPPALPGNHRDPQEGYL